MTITLQDRPEWADHIKATVDRLVAAAPPLTDEQKTRLRVLLAPAPQAAPTEELPALPPLPKARKAVKPAPVTKPTVPISGVYFVRSGELVKVGTSTNLPQRLASLRTMSPLPLEVLAVAAGGHAEERTVHERFAHLRQHGEWFTAAPELLAYIAQIGVRA